MVRPNFVTSEVQLQPIAVPPGTVQVACWNILYDDAGEYANIGSQVERLPNIAQTLDTILPDASVIGICEVEGDNGKMLAAQTNLPDSQWTPHDRENEHIGFLGKKLGEPEFIPLGGESTACITTVDEITVVMLHLTYKIMGSRLRTKQLHTLDERLADEKYVIKMGDFNTMPWQQPRRDMHHYGFQSVFRQLGIEYFPTVPIPRYKPHLRFRDRLASVVGFAVDDIYTKGLIAESAGVFEGDSDHVGLWTNLRKQ